MCTKLQRTCLGNCVLQMGGHLSVLMNRMNTGRISKQILHYEPQ